MKEEEERAGNRRALLWLAVGAGALAAARAGIRKMRTFDLPGKVVLITGGSRGLGLVLAREFARAGASLALCARDTEELERARLDLIARGADVLAVPCDVTDRTQIELMVNIVEAHFGRVDVLVNNAGIIQVGPLEHMRPEDFEAAMQIHFWAPLYTTLAVLPGMRRNHSGRIVNIASIGGKISVPHLLPYCASKFAMVGLSEGLRAELAREHILVTTVCPGLMRTGSHRHANFKGQHRKEYTLFSLASAMPGIAIGAERAARRIVSACKYGDAEVVLSLSAKVAATVHGLFPGLTADAWSLVDRILPGPGGIGSDATSGAASQTALSPSWLTAGIERAALRNNE